MFTLKSRYKILISVRPPATSAANIGGLNFTCLFQRAKIQVNKYKCGKLSTLRLSFSLGNLFSDSFTNHNTWNYLRHGINITTNQRLSPTFAGNGNTIIVRDSQASLLLIFSEGGGTSVHRLPYAPLQWKSGTPSSFQTVFSCILHTILQKFYWLHQHPPEQQVPFQLSLTITPSPWLPLTNMGTIDMHINQKKCCTAFSMSWIG